MSRLLSEPRRPETPAAHHTNELSPEMARLIADIERRKKECAGVHRRMQVVTTGSQRYPRR